MVGVLMAGLLFAAAGLLAVVIWRTNIRLEDDVAICRCDLRGVRLRRAEVQAVSAILRWDLVVVRRWAVQIDHDGGPLIYDGLVGYSFFRGRNRRVDRQVEILRRWASA